MSIQARPCLVLLRAGDMRPATADLERLMVLWLS